MQTSAQSIVEAVHSKRFRFTNEDELQVGVAQVLDGLGIPYDREVYLGGSRRDRIDFLVEGGLGIEVKIKGSSTDLIRQVHRYLGYPDIAELMVITSRAQLAWSIPESMQDKPITPVWLSAGVF